MSIGERIKQVRGKMSQEEFGAKIGVSKFSVSSYENGKRGTTDRVISDICREFNVNEDWLLNGNGDMLKKVNEIEQLKAEMGLDEYAMRALIAFQQLSPANRAVIRDFFQRVSENATEGDGQPAIVESDTVRVWTAADSDDHHQPRYEEYPRETLEKLKNAPNYRGKL